MTKIFPNHVRLTEKLKTLEKHSNGTSDAQPQSVESADFGR